MTPSSRRMRFVAGLLGLLLATAGLPACDSDDRGNLRFEVRVTTTGASLQGRIAFFSTRGDSAFTVELPASGREGVLLARSAGGPPEAGRSYRFARPDERALPSDGRFAAALRISFGGDVPTIYYARPGGELALTERTEERVSGNFEFRARRVAPGGAPDAPLSVRVIGNFSAEPGSTDNFPFFGS